MDHATKLQSTTLSSRIKKCACDLVKFAVLTVKKIIVHITRRHERNRWLKYVIKVSSVNLTAATLESFRYYCHCELVLWSMDVKANVSVTAAIMPTNICRELMPKTQEEAN